MRSPSISYRTWRKHRCRVEGNRLVAAWSTGQDPRTLLIGDAVAASALIVRQWGSLGADQPRWTRHRGSAARARGRSHSRFARVDAPIADRVRDRDREGRPDVAADPLHSFTHESSMRVAAGSNSRCYTCGTSLQSSGNGRSPTESMKVCVSSHSLGYSAAAKGQLEPPAGGQQTTERDNWGMLRIGTPNSQSGHARPTCLWLRRSAEQRPHGREATLAT